MIDAEGRQQQCQGFVKVAEAGVDDGGRQDYAKCTIEDQGFVHGSCGDGNTACSSAMIGHDTTIPECGA
jgi:hypothetical protein